MKTYVNDGKSIREVPSGTIGKSAASSDRTPPWKDPVTGRDFRNDPERNNHLFDFGKVVRSKDDAMLLKYQLQKLSSMGGGHGFSSDFQNNPEGKMRCTLHSGRTHRKTKNVLSSKHNDRNFDSEPDHIVKEKTEDNITWNWCGDGYTFEEGEKLFYEKNFMPQLKYTNSKYIKNRHKERVKTMDQWRTCREHCPEELILQIGKINNHPAISISLVCFKEYQTWLEDWNKSHGQPFQTLNWALHQDEQGAPHFQVRRVWYYTDLKTGLRTTGQEKALEIAGVPLPNPEKKDDRTNNRKMTFDKMCREKWIEVCRSHGLEIIDIPKPREQVGLTLEEFQRREDERRDEIYGSLVQFAESCINLSERVGEWESLCPLIDNFEKWVSERCEEYRREFDSGTREEILKQIVATFANSNKMVKDFYSKENRDLKRALYGYNKETKSGMSHVFGSDEIVEMFCSATPETLSKISDEMKKEGFQDVSAWMDKTNWFLNFEYGRELERKLTLSQGMGY